MVPTYEYKADDNFKEAFLKAYKIACVQKTSVAYLLGSFSRSPQWNFNFFKVAYHWEVFTEFVNILFCARLSDGSVDKTISRPSKKGSSLSAHFIWSSQLMIVIPFLGRVFGGLRC